MQIRFYFILLLAFWISPISASDSAILSRCIDYFKITGNKKYEPRQCAENIQNLLEALRKENIPLEDTQVMYINSSITPKYYRNRESENGWGWHVILVYKGAVFDLDYAETPGESNQPRVDNIQDYFRRNFGYSNDSPQNKLQASGIRIRLIKGDFFHQMLNRPVQVIGNPRGKTSATFNSKYFRLQYKGPEVRDLSLQEFLEESEGDNSQ